MTTKLEQKFYDTFGIKPKRQCYYSDTHCKNHCNKDCVNFYMKPKYPEITAEKLLQLLCMVIDEYNRNGHTFYLDSTNVKELKEEILDNLMGCIDASCDLFETEVSQIQQLFKD